MEGESFGIGRVGGCKDSLDAGIDSDNTAGGLLIWNINGVAKEEKPCLSHLFEFGILPGFDGRSPRVVCLNRLAPETESLCFGKGEVSFPANRNDEPGEFTESPFFLGFVGEVGRGDKPEDRAGQLGG